MVLFSGLQGPSGVSGCFLLCNAFPVFVRQNLVSVFEALWWPMYGWCTGVCYQVIFKYVFCLVLISCTITVSLFTIYFHCVVNIGKHLSLLWQLVLCGDYPSGPLFFVLWSAVMFLALGWVFQCDHTWGGAEVLFMAGGVPARHQRSCQGIYCVRRSNDCLW